jgi:hypothetical protein
MKFSKFLLIVFILIFIAGCKKEEENIYNEISEDIVYTDSFSPREWERPSNRKHVTSGDNQIGAFINEDVIDPRLRSILKIVSDFFKYNKSEDKEPLESILSPAAYNSFVLRHSNLLIDEKYTLRIQLPTKQTGNSQWIQFKILFNEISLIGQMELNFDDKDQCTITDFDNSFFERLKRYLNDNL